MTFSYSGTVYTKGELVGNVIDITSRLPKAKDVGMIIDEIIEITGALIADPNDRFRICVESIK
jgi:hypothetical protein